MNKLQIFKHPEFGEIRTIEINGEPWMVGKDVAVALGYLNPSKALNDHVDGEDKLNNESLSSLGQRGGWLINESGLYSLALSSRLPGAKKFRRWVTSEVLPSIRKHGGYIAGQATMSDEEFMAKALLLADSKIKARDKMIAAQAEEIKAMRPAQVFASAVTASKEVCLVGELTKLLRQNGVAMGQMSGCGKTGISFVETARIETCRHKNLWSWVCLRLKRQSSIPNAALLSNVPQR